MLRPDSSPQPRTVSDTELGVAALVLLVAVLLTVIVVPALA
jgi:hypothetical protein